MLNVDNWGRFHRGDRFVPDNYSEIIAGSACGDQATSDQGQWGPGAKCHAVTMSRPGHINLLKYHDTHSYTHTQHALAFI